MPQQPAQHVEHAVAALLTAAVDERTHVVKDDDAANPSTDHLLSALAALGWSAGAPPSVLVVRAGRGADDTMRPPVVVVLHPEPPSDRPWPGWDETVVSSGYQGCARAGRWTWYVRDDASRTLGPRLGSLPADQPDLVNELITWRTAALTRWAERAEDESGRPNKELKAELKAAKELIAALQASFSWRITAPLRGVRALRPPRARR